MQGNRRSLIHSTNIAPPPVCPSEDDDETRPDDGQTIHPSIYPNRRRCRHFLSRTPVTQSPPSPSNLHPSRRPDQTRRGQRNENQQPRNDIVPQIPIDCRISNTALAAAATGAQGLRYGGVPCPQKKMGMIMGTRSIIIKYIKSKETQRHTRPLTTNVHTRRRTIRRRRSSSSTSDWPRVTGSLPK